MRCNSLARPNSSLEISKALARRLTNRRGFRKRSVPPIQAIADVLSEPTNSTSHGDVQSL